MWTAFFFSPISRRLAQRLQQGFTLPEAMVALGIASVLAAMAIPSLSGLSARMHMQTATEQLHYSLLHARSEAIKRRGRVVVCKSGDGKRCNNDGDWTQGWVVFHDRNNNAQVEAGESVLEAKAPLKQGLVLTGNQFVAKYVSYTPLGTALLTSNFQQNGTFTSCVAGDGKSEARQIILSGGRARVAKTVVLRCPVKP